MPLNSAWATTLNGCTFMQLEVIGCCQASIGSRKCGGISGYDKTKGAETETFTSAPPRADLLAQYENVKARPRLIQ
jgi:hypothetical protein